MELTRDSTHRPPRVTPRSSVATLEPQAVGGRDIIRPSSTIRVLWRLTPEKESSSDAAR